MDKTTNAFILKDDLQHNMKLSSCCGRYISANATTTTTVTSCSRTRDKHERYEYTREMMLCVFRNDDDNSSRVEENDSFL